MGMGTGTDSVEEARALKASFLSQMATSRTTSQGCRDDDVWCFTGINAVEEFHVEDLLNLDFADDGGFFEGDKGVNKHGCGKNSGSSCSTFSGADEFENLAAGEFSGPVEGLESLEWLSQFVEDSTAELSLLFPTGSFAVEDSVNVPPVKAQATIIDAEVPRKRRSKRLRTSVLPWALLSPPLSSVDSSSTSSSSHGSSSLPVFAFPHPAPDPDWFSSAEKSLPPPPPPLEKKPKRRPDSESSGRRCTHCLVQKTPQWRTGPLGPKTLCNACGVRFKSGRLFPEYRPACSPTFSQELHSNSHRKVLEMRRRKETSTAIDDRSGFVTPVVSVVVSD